MLKRIKSLFGNRKEVSLSVNEKIDVLYDGLSVESILLRLGEDLISEVEYFCEIIHELREEIKNECGFIIPEVHIKEGIALQENEYAIYIHGNISENGFLVPNKDGIRDEFYEQFKTLMYKKMDVIFTNEIAERYIDRAQRKNSWLIWNITKALSVIEIKMILSDLINSGKSICDIGYIFEKIGEQILTNGGYQDCYFKKYNPHLIAKEIVKTL